MVTLSFQWVRAVLQVVSLVLLARLLSPGDYGLIAEATAIVGLAVVVGDFGLSLAALQAPSLTQGQRSALFWANGAIGIAIGAVVAGIAPAIAAFFQEPRLLPITLVLAVVFALGGFSVQFKVQINRDRRYVALGSIDACGQFVALAVAVALALMGAGYVALIAQQLVAGIVGLSLAAVLARWRPSWPSREPIRHLLRFGRDTFFVQVLNYVTSNLDSVLLGRFFGAMVAGLYNRAFQIVLLPLNQVLGPLTAILLPRLSAMPAAELHRTLVRVQLLLLHLIGAPLALLAAVAPEALSVVLGPRWAAAAPLVPVLVVGAIFQVLGYVFYWMFLALGRTAMLLRSELWGRIPLVVLLFALAPLGAFWVSVAVAIGQALIWAAGTLWYGRREGLDTRRLIVQSLPILTLLLVASAAARGVVVLVRPGPLSALILVGAVWMALCGAAVLLVPAIRRGARDSLRFALRREL